MRVELDALRLVEEPWIKKRSRNLITVYAVGLTLSKILFNWL